MPARSLIIQLPQELREELNNWLIERNFSGYYELEKLLENRLKEKGIEISIKKSTIHLYGQKFKQRLETLELATEQARAIVEAVGDEENILADALTRLAQEKAFQRLMSMEADEINLPFNKLVTAIKGLNDSSISLRKYKTEVRERATRTAEEVEKIGRQGGLSEETAAAIRSQILGIVD
jgi:hypothetical protein